MKWSWRIVTIFGIDIKIHLTFVFALAWGGFLWSNGDLLGALYGVFLTLVLFVIVVLHELGHSLVAQRYGIAVYDIVLLPIGGVARLGGMPDKPAQELWVALAGPAVNLALALITGPLLLGGMALRNLTGAAVYRGMPAVTSPGWLNFVAFLLMVNVSLFLFNMLPAFPMDGGRALRALLAMKLSYRRATLVAVVGGRLFAVLFGVVGILTGNIFLTVVALFIFTGAGTEGQDTREPAPASMAAVTDGPMAGAQLPVLLADTPAHLAFDRLLRSPYPVLAVVDNGGQFVGVVTRTSMERSWAAGVRGPVSLFVER
jgi:Zn-dependent protease